MKFLFKLNFLPETFFPFPVCKNKIVDLKYVIKFFPVKTPYKRNANDSR